VLNEQSGYGREVIERQLAHRETDQVRAAYNRAEYLEQRRALMQWWGEWVASRCAQTQANGSTLFVH
jgi:integrase